MQAAKTQSRTAEQQHQTPRPCVATSSAQSPSPSSSQRQHTMTTGHSAQLHWRTELLLLPLPQQFHGSPGAVPQQACVRVFLQLGHAVASLPRHSVTGPPGAHCTPSSLSFAWA